MSPGFLKTNTHIPLDQLVRIGQDVLVVASVPEAAGVAEQPRRSQDAQAAQSPLPIGVGERSLEFNGRSAFVETSVSAVESTTHVPPRRGPHLVR